MNSFFRFPHTPHLTWLGKTSPRDDKILRSGDVSEFLKEEVIVEEKIDGANIGISIGDSGDLQFQNRGQYLHLPHSGQFTRLAAWQNQHRDSILIHLKPELIAFGEWCAARHSLDYFALPDWFLLFDVYDRSAEKFWCVERRNSWAEDAGLTTVPCLKRGRQSFDSLKQLVASETSRYREGKLEGIVIRKESDLWNESRAKLVNPDFVQAIDTHWRSRTIEWNRTV